MKIKSKLTFNQYLGLMYILTYRKPLVVMATILSFLSAIGSALVQWGVLGIPASSNPYMVNIFAFLFLIVVPISIYRSTKKNFDSNKRIQETITYNFSGENLAIKGETFSSDINLSGSYKIQELKNWILIYPSNRTANLIPKSGLSNEEIMELRDIFRNLSGVKVMLKNA